MKILLIITLLLTTPVVFGAWGVSEKSVKKWDDEKLCREWGLSRLSRSRLKTGSIIANELASRPEIDVTMCMEQKVGKGKPLGFSARLEEPETFLYGQDPNYSRLQQLRKAGLEAFGIGIYKDAALVICGRKAPDLGLRSSYQNLVLEASSKKQREIGELAANELNAHIRGFGLALLLMSKVMPELCTDSGLASLDDRIEEYIYTSVKDRTAQNVELDVAIGQQLEEIISSIGKSVLKAQIDGIEVQHFCKTAEAHEFLALYFLNNSLIYRQRYSVTAEQAGSYGDCSEFAGQGSYEVPATINAIISSGSG